MMWIPLRHCCWLFRSQVRNINLQVKKKKKKNTSEGLGGSEAARPRMGWWKDGGLGGLNWDRQAAHMTQHHWVQTGHNHKESRWRASSAQSSSLPVSRNAGGQIYHRGRAAYHTDTADNQDSTHTQTLPVNVSSSNHICVWISNLKIVTITCQKLEGYSTRPASQCTVRALSSMLTWAC